MKFKKLIPELTVTDINKSKDFYIKVLGFKTACGCVKDKLAVLSLGETQLIRQISWQANDRSECWEGGTCNRKAALCAENREYIPELLTGVQKNMRLTEKQGERTLLFVLEILENK